MPPLAASDPPRNDEIFHDRAAATGLDFVHFNGMSGELYFSEMMGAGGALFDYDNDGDLDVYLVQGHMLGRGRSVAQATFPPQGPLKDRLFRNELIGPTGEGRLRFTEVTAASGLQATGYGMGVATGDYDNDGWVDLYVTNFGPNQMWRNNGDGTFADVTGATATGDVRWSVAAVFFDFDADGWLDLYVGNYVEYSLESNKLCRNVTGAADYCGPLAFRSEPDRLLRNRGDGTFEDFSSRSNVVSDYGGALGAITADFNGDGWLDLYVANDGVPNQMWMNQGGVRFENEALLAGTAVNLMAEPEASMGVAAGDFDGDGDEDLFLTHLRRETNTLYRNDGSGLFEDATVETALGNPSWPFTGFGTAFLDYDNDGWLDLFAANGAVTALEELEARGDPYPLHQPNQLFHNMGNGRFQEVTATAGAVFGLSEVSRGVAVGDVDNDGDADILLTNNSGPARLLLNRVGQDRPWAGLRLVTGDPPRDALGARVAVFVQDGPTRWRRSRSDGSYQSAGDPRVLVGLGEGGETTKVRVDWLGGGREEWEVEAGRYTTLKRGTGREVQQP